MTVVDAPPKLTVLVAVIAVEAGEPALALAVSTVGAIASVV